jgi:hypothetical protein
MGVCVGVWVCVFARAQPFIPPTKCICILLKVPGTKKDSFPKAPYRRQCVFCDV